METTQRRIEYLPLPDVLPTGGNPKQHDLPAIVRSIAVLGFTAPVVIDERTDHLIIGNGRLEALRALHEWAGGGDPDGYGDAWPEVARALEDDDGSRRAPEGIQQGDGGTWLVPVVRGWSSRDDDHARAAVVADNRLAERGGWDDRGLGEWLDEILDADPDLLNLTGFTADDLDDLLAEIGATGVIPQGETGARYAETDEEREARSENTAGYTDRTAGGAVTELILVLTLAEREEVTELTRRIRDRDGDLPAGQIVLAALREYAPEDA